MKNLQEDYSELQNTHDRSERARENRESELKSEMDRLLAENEKWHQEKIEGEVQVRKLEDRVAEMEKSLNEPKISQNITSEVKLAYIYSSCKACLYVIGQRDGCC